MPTHADVIAAVQTGEVEKLRVLLQDDPSLAAAKDAAKPDVDIFEATAAGKADKVSEILKRDLESVKSWSGDGFTALHFAAFFNQPEIATLLIRHGADVSAASKNPMKVAPLHSAAAAHSGAILRILVGNGAPPNARQEGGWTALHEAAQIGDKEMVNTLLEHGADPEVKSDTGKTPMEMASAKGHAEIVKLLEK